MRLAVNASIFDQRPSGLGTYTRFLVRALHEQHDDLVVYTSRPDAFPATHPIQSWGEPSRGWRGHLWRLAWTQWGLPLRLRAGGADVLLNPVPEGPLVCPRPQVTVVHDILPLFFPSEFPRQQQYLQVFVPALLRRSAAVIADSDQTRDDLLARYRLNPGHVQVVAPGVDPQTFYPRTAAAQTTAALERRSYFLFVGNLRPHKNLVRLLEAFARVRGDVNLMIAGYRDRRYWPTIARTVHACHLEQRVHFLDFVPGDRLPSLYSAALGVVLPSLYEGFGLPVLEAMACAAPVIASTTRGLDAATGSAALRVDPLDVAALAAAMQRLVDDPVTRESLRQRGTAHARQFRWEETARRVLSIIRDAATR